MSDITDAPTASTSWVRAGFRAAGRGILWVVTDKRPPVRRYKVDHGKIELSNPSAIWWITHAAANLALLTCYSIVLTVGFGIVYLAADAVNERPELPVVAKLYLNDFIDQWELDHNYRCVNIPSDVYIMAAGPGCRTMPPD